MATREEMLREELARRQSLKDELARREALQKETESVQKPIEEPQPTPVTEPQTDSSDSLTGFVRGLRDPIDAGAQLLPRALSTLFSAGGLLPNQISDFFRSEAKRVDALVKEEEERYQKERGETGFDTARLVGNILNPANIAVGLRAAQGARAIGTGVTSQSAISGGAVGALTPVTEEDFTKEKAKQIGIGAIGGVAGEKVIGAAGKVLAPAGESIKKMRELGVKGTLGQKLGGMFKSVEEFAKFIPLVGGAIDERQAGQILNFNKGIIGNTIKNIDEAGLNNYNKLDITEQTGSKGIKYLKNFLKDSYDNIYNTGGLKLRFDNKTGSQILQKLDDLGIDSFDNIKELQKFIDKDVIERLNLSKSTESIKLKDGAEIVFPRQIDTLTGNQYKKIDRLLRTKIRNNLKEGGNNELANGYLAIRDILKDNFYEQNKNVVYKTIDGTTKNAVKSLKSIDEGYSKFVAMVHAAGDLKIKNSANVFTPETYRKGLRDTDLSRMKQGYLFDTRPGAKEAKEAVEMLGTDAEFYRGRETLSRISRLGAVGGLGAAGTDVATTGGLGIIGGRLLYTEAGQKLFDLLLMARPSISVKAGEAVQKIPTGARAVTGAEIGQGMMSE